MLTLKEPPYGQAKRRVYLHLVHPYALVVSTAMPLRIRPYLELVRFTLCLIVFAMALEGYWLALGRFDWFRTEAILAALTVACAIGFANAMNDLIDAPVDRVNAPRRPIPSGAISENRARTLVIALGSLSLVLGYSAGVRMGALALGALLGSVLYNLWARKIALVGNLIVALLCALTLAAGYCVVMGGTFPFVPFASAFTFLLAREMLGTVCDMEGDRVGGRTTLAMVLGPNIVLLICLGLALLALAMQCAAVILGQVAYPAIYLACVFCASLAPVAWAAWTLVRDRRPARVRAVSFRLRLVFIANIVTFLFFVPQM